MASGLVFNIQKYSIQDGPGIRTTVFFKGCPLACWWCHNPESQSAEPELIVVETRCIQCGQCREVCPQTKKGSGVLSEEDLHRSKADRSGDASGNKTPDPFFQCTRCGACVAACPTEARQLVGRRMTVAEVLAEVLKDRIIYDESGGGATFSGGEPLMQPQFLLGLLEACRKEGVHTALDTCGYAPREQLLAAARLADLILYDLKIMDDYRHRECTGVSNGLILENLEALGRAHGNIWLRVPLIPGFNDDADELESIARFARTIGGVRQVNLLPYHETGLHKFARLGKTYRPGKLPPPSAESLEQAAGAFRALGLVIHTGG